MDSSRHSWLLPQVSGSLHTHTSSTGAWTQGLTNRLVTTLPELHSPSPCPHTFLPNTWLFRLNSHFINVSFPSCSNWPNVFLLFVMKAPETAPGKNGTRASPLIHSLFTQQSLPIFFLKIGTFHIESSPGWASTWDSPGLLPKSWDYRCASP